MSSLVRTLVKRCFCLLFVFYGLVVSAENRAGIKSAVRDPHRSYLIYKRMALENLRHSRKVHPQTYDSALEVATKYSELAQQASVQWPDFETLIQRFKWIRDLRFLPSPQFDHFLRRSTWLYPDDGCFARAGLVIANLSQAHADLPNKVFVFGDLTVQTPNSPEGSVSWWYHVAPLVRVGDSSYVLDPAVDPTLPLNLKEWLGRMSSDVGRLEVAICESGTYIPDDSCKKSSDGVERIAFSDQQPFLNLEWERLRALGRNPGEELGSRPPWQSVRVP